MSINEMRKFFVSRALFRAFFVILQVEKNAHVIMFEIQFTPIIIALLCGVCVCFFYLLLGFRHYVRIVGRAASTDNTAEETDDTQLPGVSVIVCAEDDARNLETLLPAILDQDYPAPFEVIVVNDGALPSTKEVIARLEERYSNLYMTFTPLESRSLSRRKLALTLGIKAARHEVVVLTTGNTRILSDKWLRLMARHFGQGKEVVIGYAAPVAAIDPDSEEAVKEPWKRLHAFDTVRTAVEYLSWGLAGRPYRATCHNLAYRRSVFFRNKGFSRTLHLKYGDDDMFVNEVANGANTVVEISQGAIVEVPEMQPQPAHKVSKLRYGYTAGKLSTWSRVFFGSCSLAWWIFTGCCIGLALVGLPSLVPLIAASVLYLSLTLILAFAWRSTSRALHSRSLLITVPWFMTFEPIYNLWYRIKGFIKRGSNLSWS